jgi:hypothetical protein
MAAARATVFHGVDVVVVQKIATAVCSDVRVLLFAAPTDLTSFTSLALAELVTGKGPGTVI